MRLSKIVAVLVEILTIHKIRSGELESGDYVVVSTRITINS